MARRSLLILLCLAASLFQGSATAVADPCLAPGTLLMGDRDGRPVFVSPDGEEASLPAPGSDAWAIWRARQLPVTGRPSRWNVARTATDRDVSIEVIDTSTGEAVVAASFDKRIELAASIVSPSHRFTVYVQGNNVATEITVLDAVTRSVRLVSLTHDADLAPFAMGLAFRPGERCLAVSLERPGGPGPETWLLDVQALAPVPVDLDGLLVARWVQAP